MKPLRDCHPAAWDTKWYNLSANMADMTQVKPVNYSVKLCLSWCKGSVIHCEVLRRREVCSTVFVHYVIFGWQVILYWSEWILVNYLIYLFLSHHKINKKKMAFFPPVIVLVTNQLKFDRGEISILIFLDLFAVFDTMFLSINKMGFDFKYSSKVVYFLFFKHKVLCCNW